jgi:hypothetical protein
MKILFVDLNLLNENEAFKAEDFTHIFGISETKDLAKAQKLAQENVSKVDAIAVAQQQADGKNYYRAEIFVYPRTPNVEIPYKIKPIQGSKSILNILANVLFETIKTEKGDGKISAEWLPEARKLY